jgi:transposase-like protein
MDRSTPAMTQEMYETLELDSRVSLIQQLIPLGLMLVSEELSREVELLAGSRYSRKVSAPQQAQRWGNNPGSVKLLGQRLAISVPRLRGPSGEVPLKSYEMLHRGEEIDVRAFRRVLSGLSCRDYEAAAESMPGAIGLSKSTVSARFIEATQAKLQELQERDLRGLDIVAMFIDGKAFADDQMVIALGVTLTGEKVFLGFVQTDTENSRVLSEFLRSLLSRGLDVSKGVLAIIDGGKGLRSAVKEVLKKHAVVQRCQWHKRENIVGYLSKAEQPLVRRRLQRAYERPTYDEAKKALMAIRKDLEQRNASAAASLDEGFEETLTLHKLRVFALLSISLKTTNCIESVNALAEQRCGKVDHWKNASQKNRWLAATLLDIEPRLKRVRGYRHLPKLRQALMKMLNLGVKAHGNKAAEAA